MAAGWYGTCKFVYVKIEVFLTSGGGGEAVELLLNEFEVVFKN